MKIKKLICFLLLVSLVINSHLIVYAEDYDQPVYDENGFVLSPDELNASKSESTYNDEIEKLQYDEEESGYFAGAEIEYHSEDEEPEDITPYISIESYPIGTEIETDAESGSETEFYAYIDNSRNSENLEPRNGDFSNVRYWGTLSSNKSTITITLHVLEKAFTSAAFTFAFFDYNDKYIERVKFSTDRLAAGTHNIKYDVPVHATIREKITFNSTAWNGTVSYSASCVHHRYNFEGGAYGKLNALEGQRHHMSAKAAIGPLSAYSGPAARILTSDHQQTSSYGSKTYYKKQQDLIHHGKFLEAQNMDFVELIQLNALYNQAINEVKAYTRSLGYVGTVRLGWQIINNNWYYYNQSQIMQTGWIKDGNQWYYLDSSGAMRTGWINDNGKWYYLNSSGAMQTGWLNDNGKWYYLKSSGEMACNEILQIDGKKYHFDTSGQCLNPYNLLKLGVM